MIKIKKISFLAVILFIFLSFSSGVNALLNQIPSWGDGLNETTSEGSKNFTIATYLAFKMYSAMERNQLQDAYNISEEIITYLNKSKEMFVQASNLSRDLQKADDWISKRQDVIQQKLQIPVNFGVWQDIASAIKTEGAKGLIKLSIGSIDRLKQTTVIFIHKLRANRLPSHEEQWNALYILTKEIMKGVIISEIFYRE
jgi:hypothetical protein